MTGVGRTRSLNRNSITCERTLSDRSSPSTDTLTAAVSVASSVIRRTWLEARRISCDVFVVLAHDLLLKLRPALLSS